MHLGLRHAFIFDKRPPFHNAFSNGNSPVCKSVCSFLPPFCTTTLVSDFGSKLCWCTGVSGADRLPQDFVLPTIMRAAPLLAARCGPRSPFTFAEEPLLIKASPFRGRREEPPDARACGRCGFFVTLQPRDVASCALAILQRRPESYRELGRNPRPLKINASQRKPLTLADFYLDRVSELT